QLNLTTRHNDAPPVMLRLAFKSPEAADDATAAAPPSTSVPSTGVTPVPPPSSPTAKPVAVVTASPPAPTTPAPIIAKPPVTTAPTPAPARVATTTGAVVATPPAKPTATT